MKDDGNLNSDEGRQKFKRLLVDEMIGMADHSSKYSSKKEEDVRYVCLREYAYQYYENLIPDFRIRYLALKLVDRFCLKEFEIPSVLDDWPRNTHLFLKSCASISWKLNTEVFLLQGFMVDQSSMELMRMEVFVCEKINWVFENATPFDILNLLHHHYMGFSTSSIQLARNIVMKSQADIRFTAFRPSTLGLSIIQIVDPSFSVVCKAFGSIRRAENNRCYTMMMMKFNNIEFEAGDTVSNLVAPAPRYCYSKTLSLKPLAIRIPVQFYDESEEGQVGNEGLRSNLFEDLIFVEEENAFFVYKVMKLPRREDIPLGKEA